MRYACGKCWRNGITLTQTWWPAFQIPVLLMQSDMPMNPVFLLPVRLFKYTPTWPRSFMPANQNQRSLIARMKLIPVDTLIRNKSLLLIDDSIVRGTQLGETTEFFI